MAITVPTWFKYRQGKTEPVSDNLFRLTGPNLPPAVLGLRRGDNGKLQGILRTEPDGPDVAVTDPRFDREYEAWEVAFEMYRQTVII